MKYPIMIFFFISMIQGGQRDYSEYYHEKTLRIDFHHWVDSDTDIYSVDNVFLDNENYRPLPCIDVFNNGKYYFKVYDLKTGVLIFSSGFDCMAAEYAATAEALAGKGKVFSESRLFPFPKAPVKITIEKRNPANRLLPLFHYFFDPEKQYVNSETKRADREIIGKVMNRSPLEAADIVVLFEGYEIGEKKKAKKDFNRIKEVFLKTAPYAKQWENINLYGVFKASPESGCDMPDKNVYRNTALGFSFHTFQSPRYLLTEENEALRDMASMAPYDAVLVCVNTDRYGGGGIYRQYAVFAADHPMSEFLMLHEFGHSFAGLADEYYTSNVAYENFYSLKAEPTEPNITALLNPGQVKWASLLSPGLEIPTPWRKSRYDSLVTMKMEIKKEKKGRKEEEKLKELEDEINEIFYHSELYGKVGVFEGAGYMSDGLYRPSLNCIMRAKDAKKYCPVCEKSIERMILFYQK